MRANSILSASSTIAFSRKSPWITFCLLIGIMFFLNHNVFTTIQETPTAEEQMSMVGEGNFARRIGLLLLGLLGLVNVSRRSKKRFQINGSLGWLLLFFIYWSFLTVFWSTDEFLTIRRLVVFSLFLAGIVGAAKRFSFLDVCSFAFASSTIYLVMGVVVEIAFGTFHPLSSNYRFSGTITPNSQGINCAMMFLSAVYFQNNETRSKALYFVAAGIAFSFLCLTGSRGAFISMGLALAVYSMLVTSSLRITIWIWSTCIVLLLLMLVIGDSLVPYLGQGVLLGRGDTNLPTVGVRIQLWKECLVYIAQQPILGYGYNAFWTPKMIAKMSYSQNWGPGIAEGHSAYIDLALGTGLVGMLTYVLILGILAKRLFALYKCSNSKTYAYWFALIVFGISNGIIESVIIVPTALSFIITLVLINMSFLPKGIRYSAMIPVRNRSSRIC